MVVLSLKDITKYCQYNLNGLKLKIRKKHMKTSNYNTPSIPKLIWVKNVRAIVVCGFLMKSLKKPILKIWKKSWVPFGSYLLNSTADSAQFEWKWAGLAVLFSRYLPNGTHDFFQIFRICFFKDFIKNPQTTIALTFLTHIVSGIDGVCTDTSRLWQIS